MLAVCWPLAAFGGLVRDPIGSTLYWEIDRAVMRFSYELAMSFSVFLHHGIFMIYIGKLFFSLGLLNDKCAPKNDGPSLCFAVLLIISPVW